MIVNFATPDSAADLKALYKVALTLSKHEKVFQDWEIIKE